MEDTAPMADTMAMATTAAEESLMGRRWEWWTRQRKVGR